MSVEKLQKELSDLLTPFADIESLFLEILSSKQEDIQIHFDNFYSFLDKFSVSTHKKRCIMLLEMISQISFFIPLNDELMDRVIRIIDHLFVDKNNLNISGSFKAKEILKIFSNNKYFILHLYEKNVIKLEELINYLYRISQNNNYNKPLVYYFLPEILEYEKKNTNRLTNLIVKRNELSQVYQKLLDENKLKDFINERNGSNRDRYLLKAIKNDNINDFLSFISQTDYDLSKEIELNDFELNHYLLSKKKMNIIDYSLIYGSINVFKYLVTQEKLSEKISLESLNYAVIGGNNEIIHMVENSFIFDKKCLKSAIECHRHDLYHYLLENYQLAMDPSDEFKVSLESCNFNHMILFMRFSNFFNNICSNGEILFYVCIAPSIFLLKFTLLLPNIDINQKEKEVFLYIYSFIFFLIRNFYIFLLGLPSLCILLWTR